jgi:hypothetical protein
VQGEQLVALVSSGVAVVIALGSLIVSYLSFKRSGPQLTVSANAMVERAKEGTATVGRIYMSVVNSGQAAIQVKVVECRVSYDIGRRLRRRHTAMIFSHPVEGGATRLDGFHTKSCLFPAPLLMLSLFHNKGRDAWLTGAVYTGSGTRISSKPVRISRYALSRRVPSVKAMKIRASIYLPERFASKVGVPLRYRNRRVLREQRLDRVTQLMKPGPTPKAVEFVDG